MNKRQSKKKLNVIFVHRHRSRRRCRFPRRRRRCPNEGEILFSFFCLLFSSFFLLFLSLSMRCIAAAAQQPPRPLETNFLPLPSPPSLPPSFLFHHRLRTQHLSDGFLPMESSAQINRETERKDFADLFIFSYQIF